MPLGDDALRLLSTISIQPQTFTKNGSKTFVDLRGNLFSKVCHHLAQLSHTDPSVSIFVKHLFESLVFKIISTSLPTLKANAKKIIGKYKNRPQRHL